MLSVLQWENWYSISFQVEWDMILVTVFLSILWTKWISIWLKVEKKTVTTIISHSMWKEMEYQFSHCMLQFLSSPCRKIIEGVSSPLKPLGTILPSCSRGFNGTLNWASMRLRGFIGALSWSMRLRSPSHRISTKICTADFCRNPNMDISQAVRAISLQNVLFLI